MDLELSFTRNGRTGSSEREKVAKWGCKICPDQQEQQPGRRGAGQHAGQQSVIGHGPGSDALRRKRSRSRRLQQQELHARRFQSNCGLSIAPLNLSRERVHRSKPRSQMEHGFDEVGRMIEQGD